MKVIDVKITLAEVEPEVSRNLEVPVNLRMDIFHDTIQYAMGWNFCHLYLFELGKNYWGEYEKNVFEEAFGAKAKCFDPARSKLSEIIKSKRANKLIYTYDFGDSWKHVFQFGKQTEADPEIMYPVLTGGTGACPLEDCGGAGGHAEIIEELAKPEEERDEELMTWIGSYEPYKFDIERHYMDVAKYAHIMHRLGHI